MSEQKEFDTMMTEEDILVITRISNAEAPHSQRAQALLAVDAGKTQEEAAEASGLRATQVKYWVARYRKSGLAIFPEALMVEEEIDVVEVEETAVSLEKSVSANIEQAPTEQKDQEKKNEQKVGKPQENKGQKSLALATTAAASDKKKKKKKSRNKKKDKKSSKKQKKDGKTSKKKKNKKSKKEKKSNKSKKDKKLKKHKKEKSKKKKK